MQYLVWNSWRKLQSWLYFPTWNFPGVFSAKQVPEKSIRASLLRSTLFPPETKLEKLHIFQFGWVFKTLRLHKSHHHERKSHFFTSTILIYVSGWLLWQRVLSVKTSVQFRRTWVENRWTWDLNGSWVWLPLSRYLFLYAALVVFPDVFYVILSRPMGIVFPFHFSAICTALRGLAISFTMPPSTSPAHRLRKFTASVYYRLAGEGYD